MAYQGGPRRLADEVLEAWTVWEERGAPGLYDFGLTRTAGGQWVWSGDPNGPRWQPLAPAAVHWPRGRPVRSFVPGAVGSAHPARGGNRLG